MDWHVGKLRGRLVWLFGSWHHLMVIHEKNRVHCVFMIVWELQPQIIQLPLFDFLNTTHQFGLLISKAQVAKWALVYWFRRLKTWSGRTRSFFNKTGVLSIILEFSWSNLFCEVIIRRYLWIKKLLLLLLLSDFLKLF